MKEKISNEIFREKFLPNVTREQFNNYLKYKKYSKLALEHYERVEKLTKLYKKYLDKIKDLEKDFKFVNEQDFKYDKKETSKLARKTSIEQLQKYLNDLNKVKEISKEITEAKEQIELKIKQIKEQDKEEFRNLMENAGNEGWENP